MSNQNPTFLLSSHPSRLHFPSHLLSSRSILSLSRFPLHHQSDPQEIPWLSSHRFSFYLLLTRAAILMNTPSHDLLGRLGREESLLSYRLSLFPLFTFYPSLASACLSHRQNRFSSLSTVLIAVKDENIDKTICCCRRFDNACVM